MLFLLNEFEIFIIISYWRISIKNRADDIHNIIRGEFGAKKSKIQAHYEVIKMIS